MRQDQERIAEGSPASADAVGAGLGKVLLRRSPHVRGFSRRGGALRLDGRSCEARYLRAMREQLSEHVGGQPSAVQRAIIDRLSWLALHMAKIDARTIEDGQMNDHARREYLAWSNAYSRLLGRLGMDSAADKQSTPSLNDYLLTTRANGR